MARRKKDAIEINLDETRIVRGAGDNSPEKPVDGERLLEIVENIEKLANKKAQINQQISEVFADSKAIGYDGRTLRTIIRERKMDEAKRKEEAELLDIYRRAVGLENG